MALLNFGGFEAGTDKEFASVVGSPLYPTSPPSPHGGLRVLSTQNVQSRVYIQKYAADGLHTVFTEGTLWCGFWVYFDTFTGSGPQHIASVDNGSGSKVVDIERDEDGAITINGTSRSATAAIVGLDEWALIEFKSVPNGSSSVRVNQGSSVTVNGSNPSGGNDRLVLGTFAAIGTFYYDDWYVDDAGWIPPGQCLISLPEGAGTNSGWTNGTGSTFAVVDEVPPNDDTDYIAETAVAGTHDFAMQDEEITGVGGSIAAVKLMSVVRNVAAAVGSIALWSRSDATNVTETAWTNAGTITTYVALQRVKLLTNAGAAWTTSGVQSLQVGVVNNNANDARCTAIYAMVWVTPPTLGSAGIIGQGAVTATANTTKPQTASIVGLGAVTATGQVTKLATAAIVGQATISATATIGIDSASAQVAGTSVLTASPTITKPSAASIVGQATVGATGQVEIQATALIQGTSAIFAQSGLEISSSAIIIGTSRLRGVATIIRLEDVLTGVYGPVVYVFRYERRTKNNQFLSDVSGAIQSCSIEANNDRTVFRTASFRVDASVGAIDPLADHIAVFMDLKIDEELTESIQMGLFTLTVPRKTFTPDEEMWDLAASDNSIHLLEAMTTASYTIASGQNYLSEVQAILDDLGLSYALPSSTLTLPAAQTWPIGTTWSTIVTWLLSGANMYQLAFDRRGVAVTRTRISMSSRTPDVVYTGDDFILIPIVEEAETTRLANQVVAVVNDPNRPPLSSVATNNDPDSPISVINLGRTITKIIPADAAADQSTLDDIAQSYLESEAGLYRRATLLTSIDPRRDPNEIYEVTADDLYVAEKWWCRNWRVDLTIGGQMSHTLGKVERVG